MDIGSSFQSLGAAAENDLSPYDVDVMAGFRRSLLLELLLSLGQHFNYTLGLFSCIIQTNLSLTSFLHCVLCFFSTISSFRTLFFSPSSVLISGFLLHNFLKTSSIFFFLLSARSLEKFLATIHILSFNKIYYSIFCFTFIFYLQLFSPLNFYLNFAFFSIHDQLKMSTFKIDVMLILRSM